MRSWPYRKVFLSGATGLIGGQILREMLELPMVEEVVCLVRASNKQSGAERLSARLEKFGLSEAELREAMAKVRPVEGEITQGLWDIKPAELRRLRRETELMIHCAASTSFVDVGSCEAMNVKGTEQMLEVVKGCEKLRRLVHFSTATLCGYRPNAVVKEQDSPSEKDKHLVAYTRTKAQAEQILWEKRQELPLLVVRPSITMAQGSEDPKQARLFLWSLYAMAQLPFVPVKAESLIDIVTLDFVVKSTLRLIGKGEDLAHDCYHLTAGQMASVSAGEVNEAIMSVAKEDGPQLIPPEQWNESHEEVLAEQGLSTLYQSLLYLPFINLNLIYDNSRLVSELEDDLPHLPKFTDYVGEMLRVITPERVASERVEGFGL
ncbi:MAG: SDR family oxidoreductase [Phycisphaerae bacterium]|nr:SDR family oxidoreductase [Phycisphaerae bacterium]